MRDILFKALMCFVLFPSISFSQLVPIGEGELSNTTGQAFINVDQTNGLNGFDFTKVTLGLSIETIVNADSIALGTIARTGETLPSDIAMSNFALGYIDENGIEIPFEITDPFIELAYQNNNVVGVRLGFGGARGVLTSEIESLTGNITVNINDVAASLTEGDTGGLGAAAAFFLANSPISATAKLVDADKDSPGFGLADPIRATSIGLLNNDKFRIDANGNAFLLGVSANFVGGIDCQSWSFWNCNWATITSNGCDALGIDTCFALNKYNKLDIGKKQADGTFEPASGLFLSFQSKNVIWMDDGIPTPTVSGAFMNIPDGGLEVTLAQAFNGTKRVRTRYVDPYFGN